MSSSTSQPIDVPVIIVGGGCCGLTLSSILSDHNVEHFLLEQHSGTSYLPKAHYLNQRTMEIFRQHGISDAIYKSGSPIRNMSQVLWQSSLGGTGRHDRKVIGRLPCFGCAESTPMHETYRRDSPTMSCNLPLIRTEPILRTIAEKKNPGKVLFGHRVAEVVENDDSVLVTVKTPEGLSIQYRTKFVVGADGGKTIGPIIGAVMEGQTHLDDKVSVHFKADLSKYWDDRTLINHFINSEGGTIAYSGALVVTGPTWGRHSEEWTMHFSHRLDDPERFNEANLVPRLRQLLKLPCLEVEVLHISHWIQERVLASKYSEGRLFLAGDAAHRHPPTTGLGLNTAVSDAHNLAWKLALVIKYQANPSILDSYEAERRPVGRRNCDWAAFTSENRKVLNAAIGLSPGQLEANRARFDQLLEDSDTGRTTRAQIQRILESQNIEFNAHDLELGFRYHIDPRLQDQSEPPPSDPLGQTYYPTTRPGHRLPHAWLAKDGKRLSTHDLVSNDGSFCIITDEEGGDWIQVAARLSGKALKIHTAQIKSNLFAEEGEYEDLDDRWSLQRGVNNGGAILVRPDNFVAWRSKEPSSRNGEELAEAIAVITGRN